MFPVTENIPEPKGPEKSLLWRVVSNNDHFNEHEVPKGNLRYLAVALRLASYPALTGDDGRTTDLLASLMHEHLGIRSSYWYKAKMLEMGLMDGRESAPVIIIPHWAAEFIYQLRTSEGRRANAGSPSRPKVNIERLVANEHTVTQEAGALISRLGPDMALGVAARVWQLLMEALRNQQ